MDKKTKILFTVLILLVAWSIGMTYYRAMIKHDFYTEQSESEEAPAEETVPQEEVVQ